MRPINKNRVVVAMSGGVDSSVAAAILKKRGFDVIGITLKTWPKEDCGASFGRVCCSLESIVRARSVAEKLEIPHYVLDVHERFRREVIDYFALEYSRGRTPNPCIVCNDRIKLAVLIEKADALNARSVATGHFARVAHDKRSGRFLLKGGKDTLKDQAYFLFCLSQSQLSRTLFPVGSLTKEAVRRRARRLGLPVWNTPSSQDICFVQEMGYAEYLRKKTGLMAAPGDIVNTSGEVLGTHKGISSYTIGQRRGLGVAHKTPLYVTGFDLPKNRVIVGAKMDLFKKTLIAQRLNWIAKDAPAKPLKVHAKIRYNHKSASAIVTRENADEVRVEFSQPQEAPTPGQAVVFYQKDVVVGGGWIKTVIG